MSSSTADALADTDYEVEVRFRPSAIEFANRVADARHPVLKGVRSYHRLMNAMQTPTAWQAVLLYDNAVGTPACPGNFAVFRVGYLGAFNQSARR